MTLSITPEHLLFIHTHNSSLHSHTKTHTTHIHFHLYTHTPPITPSPCTRHTGTHFLVFKHNCHTTSTLTQTRHSLSHSHTHPHSKFFPHIQHPSSTLTAPSYTHTLPHSAPLHNCNGKNLWEGRGTAREGSAAPPCLPLPGAQVLGYTWPSRNLTGGGCRQGAGHSWHATAGIPHIPPCQAAHLAVAGSRCVPTMQVCWGRTRSRKRQPGPWHYLARMLRAVWMWVRGELKHLGSGSHIPGHRRWGRAT